MRSTSNFQNNTFCKSDKTSYRKPAIYATSFANITSVRAMETQDRIHLNEASKYSSKWCHTAIYSPITQQTNDIQSTEEHMGKTYKSFVFCQIYKPQDISAKRISGIHIVQAICRRVCCLLEPWNKIITIARIKHQQTNESTRTNLQTFFNWIFIEIFQIGQLHH